MRFPQAQHAWNTVWRGLENEHLSAEAVKDQLAEKYGEQILQCGSRINADRCPNFGEQGLFQHAEAAGFSHVVVKLVFDNPDRG